MTETEIPTRMCVQSSQANWSGDISSRSDSELAESDELEVLRMKNDLFLIEIEEWIAMIKLP